MALPGQDAGGAARILVVEDDSRLARLLVEQLGHAGYRVDHVDRGVEALAWLEQRPCDLVLLDLNLPDLDGIEIAERLRGEGPAVLMLTARADVDSRVEGLYAGASDYLTKPFSIQELLARVHVRLRERSAGAAVRVGALELDPAASACRAGGAQLVLPEREFAVLHLLARHRGRLFSRADLERALYGPEVPDSNTVEVFVYNLRRKLARLGERDLIRTVRGRGYMIL